MVTGTSSSVLSRQVPSVTYLSIYTGLIAYDNHGVAFCKHVIGSAFGTSRSRQTGTST